jgi:ADP-ribosylglycohydrolase
LTEIKGGTFFKMDALSTKSRCQGALYGMYIGDALAMPVHWYYNRAVLKQDYGRVHNYLAPKNPHPDSELWKHHYKPTGPNDDILHEQARYWGKKGVHYHQFLRAGENTLNVKLCSLLIRSLKEKQTYDPMDYLDRLISVMLTPGQHRDTYIDEYLRGFFKRYAKGVPIRECGLQEKHLSGLIGLLPIVIYYRNDPERAYTAALEHVSLTHRGPLVEMAARLFIEVLLALFSGQDVRNAITELINRRSYSFLEHDFMALINNSDAGVMDNHLGAGCFIDESLPVVIYLLLKYDKQAEKGLIVNTNLGGNNAARGAILGALLGAANGVQAFPVRWIKGLIDPPEEL